MSLVQLELDEVDKKNFTELQNEIGKAKAEIAQVTNKMRTRAGEGKHAELTLVELADMGDDTTSYEQARRVPCTRTAPDRQQVARPCSPRACAQVGKMFIIKPIGELRAALTATRDKCKAEIAGLEEKRTHVDTAYKKVQEDFQEFVNAHLVEAPAEGGDEKKAVDAS